MNIGQAVRLHTLSAKDDRPRTIDAVIDYFGDGRQPADERDGTTRPHGPDLHDHRAR